jgi:hypothetical protein
MHTDLDRMPLMHAEHVAWLELAVTQLRKVRGLDVNEDQALHAAIVLWGERLVALRVTQDESVRQAALEEAQALYNRHVGFEPA